MTSIEFIKEMLYWTNEDNVKRKKILIQILNDLECLEQLEKENKELKEQYETLDRAYNSCHLDYEDLKGENENLTKIIKILKDYIEYWTFGAEYDFDTYVTSQCSSEEQYLLMRY